MYQRVGLFIAALCLSIAASSVCSVRTYAQDEKPSQKAAAKETTSQVRGRVVMEADGKPVANADVRLVSWTKNNTRYDVKKTRSDKNGEFVFDGVDTGQHRLAAFFEDYASRKSLYKGEPVDLASTKPVTLTLAKMPRIAVKVVSKADGKPIAGANVQLVWSDTERENRADENGTVMLRADARGLARKGASERLCGKGRGREFGRHRDGQRHVPTGARWPIVWHRQG